MYRGFNLIVPIIGTSPNVVGTPNEQIGYLASEEYALRMNSPRPQSAAYHSKAHSNSSQTHIESPLRKASFPVDVHGRKEFEKNKDSHLSARHQSDIAVESEAEDEDIIHVDPPSRRISKFGGGGYDPPTEDLGPHGGNTAEEGGWIDERGYGVPILASDEVAKEQGSEFQQPAVSPPQERRGSAYFTESDLPHSHQSGPRRESRTSSVSGSRPSSRPASIHGGLRFNPHEDREDMHTPLEDVEEYEPLFPDEENKEGRPMTAADRFRRRPDMKRRFPSQDIWEDTPNSLQLQTTVSTPEVQEEKSSAAEKPASAVFEPPETESARKREVSEEDKANLLPKEQRWANSHFKPHLRDEISSRPGMKQRFPSRDIWEDTPDSARLETTVGEPQSDELRSPPDEGLIAGAVVITAGRPDGEKAVDEDIGASTARMGATSGKPVIPPRPTKSKLGEELPDSAVPAQPPVPARPSPRQQRAPSPIATAQPDRSTANQLRTSSPLSATPSQDSPIEARKGPVLPDRPKPQVPARPAKPVNRGSSDNIPLTKTTSARSTTSVGSAEDGSGSPKEATPAPALKPKPMNPSRPLGNKIASLKAGFLSDLDKRLQLGPQAPKHQEKAPEPDKDAAEEKAPLSDVRKGRAKGPARRKPAAPPSAGVGEESATPTTAGGKFEISSPCTVWQISDDGALEVSSTEKVASGGSDSTSSGTEVATPVSTTNSAEESSHPSAPTATEDPGYTDASTRDETQVSDAGRETSLERSGQSLKSATENADPSHEDSTVSPNMQAARPSAEESVHSSISHTDERHSSPTTEQGAGNKNGRGNVLTSLDQNVAVDDSGEASAKKT